MYAVANNKYYVSSVSSNKSSIWKSINGVDWQEIYETSQGTALQYDIAYLNGVYITVGMVSTGFISTDLITWEQINLPKYSTSKTSNYLFAETINDKFIITNQSNNILNVGTNNSSSAYSTNGIDWNRMSSTILPRNPLRVLEIDN